MTTNQAPSQAWAPTPGAKYQGSDVGHEMVAGDYQGQEPSAPTLPPPPVYQGYEGSGYDEASCPPPPAYDNLPPPESPEMAMAEFKDGSTVSEEVVRESMLELVSQNCCYGDDPAKDMKLNSIEPLPALHYILESFCEARKTKHKTEPYRGQPIDGPQNGTPPQPWAIPINATGLFVTEKHKTEVPHTATVIPCSKCFAQGYVRCWNCHGRGHKRCISCFGSGWRNETKWVDGETENVRIECWSCHGHGHSDCISCHGYGMIRCSKCDGHRMLKSYIKLTVKFGVEKNDFIYERTAMPDELVRGVEGQMIFEQSFPRVGPIIGYKINEINKESAELVRRHATAFTDKRLHYQRHQLRAVPVTEVRGKWKDDELVFWVYGNERKCHFPDYPNRCCCNCSIL